MFPERISSGYKPVTRKRVFLWYNAAKGELIFMGAKILVIEDEAAINDVICMSLEAAGHVAVPFFDGE